MSIKIRASSLSGLFDCPARWAATHIDKKYMPTNAKALLGKAVHASTALYDQSVLDGSEIAVYDAAGAAVDTIHHPDEEVAWLDGEKPSELERIALSLHHKYCLGIAPSQNYTAVEVLCDDLTIADLGITLTGTTDRIVDTGEGLGIADIKTGKAAVKTDGTVETKGHAYQLGVYELLAEFASGVPITAPAQIIGLNTAKTEANQRVGTGRIVDARSVLLGDDETPGILQTAADILKRGVFWGNPKSMLCHGSYCPIYNSCNYRK